MLSISSTSGAVDTVAGRYLEYSVTFTNGVDSLAGHDVYIGVGLTNISEAVSNNLPASGFKLTGYAGIGLEGAIFYGKQPDNNLEVVIDKIDNFNFTVYYRFIMSSDPGPFPAQGIANLNHFISQANNLNNIYAGETRLIGLQAWDYNAGAVISTAKATDTIAADWYGVFMFGSGASYNIAHGTVQGKTGYSCIDDTVIYLHMLEGSLPGNIDVMLFKRGDENDTGPSNIDKEINYMRHPSTPVNALLPIAAITTSTLISGSPPYYTFHFTVDVNYFDGVSQYYAVVSYDVAGTLKTFLIPLPANCSVVPSAVTLQTGVTEDETFATTQLVDCLLDIPEHYTEKIFSSILESSYNAELSALGIPGSFNSKFITVLYHIVDALPINGQAVVGVGNSVDGLFQVAGQTYALLNHKVQGNELYYIVFEWVFNTHKLYNPIAVYPVGAFPAARDATVDPMTITGKLLGLCYEYDEDVIVCDSWTAFLEPRTDNVLLLQSINGGEYLETEAVNNVVVTDVGGGEGTVCLEIDHTDITDIDNCFIYLTWNDPVVTVPVCASFAMGVTQVTSDPGSFIFNVTYGPILRVDIDIIRNGEVVASFKDVEDSTNYTFNAETLAINRFVYKVRAFGSGCDMEGEQYLETNNVFADIDNGSITIS